MTEADFPVTDHSFVTLKTNQTRNVKWDLKSKKKDLKLKNIFLLLSKLNLEFEKKNYKVDNNSKKFNR